LDDKTAIESHTFPFKEYYVLPDCKHVLPADVLNKPQFLFKLPDRTAGWDFISTRAIFQVSKTNFNDHNKGSADVANCFKVDPATGTMPIAVLLEQITGQKYTFEYTGQGQAAPKTKKGSPAVLAVPAGQVTVKDASGAVVDFKFYYVCANPVNHRSSTITGYEFLRYIPWKSFREQMLQHFRR
jgi:hypothetical protein